MKNNNELSYINSLMNDKIHESKCVLKFYRV